MSSNKKMEIVSKLLLLFFLTTTYAVVNKSPNADRREINSYNAPAIYGTPAIAKYPPPPPDIVPPLTVPHKEYGVPILKYGPPKVNIEYGPPANNFNQHRNQLNYNIHYYNGNSGAIKGGQLYRPSQSYGEPLRQKPIYGIPHRSPNGPHQKFPALKPTYIKIPNNIGINSGASGLHGVPSGSYGLPSGESDHSSIQQIIPIKVISESNFNSNPILKQPNLQYGPPSLGPKTSDIRCDGWRPISGPTIHIDEQHSGYNNIINQQQYLSVVPPSKSYLPSSSHIDNGISSEHTDFHKDNLNSIGLSDVNIIKSQGIELTENNLEGSYVELPSNSIATNHNYAGTGGVINNNIRDDNVYNNIILSTELKPPSDVYGVPHTYGGLAMEYGSISGNLKHWPANGKPPNRPLQFRAPVPNGLIESIGIAVENSDKFGLQKQQSHHYSGGSVSNNIYLPPPTHEVPPSGLEALPLQDIHQPLIDNAALGKEINSNNIISTSNIGGTYANGYTSYNSPHYLQELRYSEQTGCGHGPQLQGSAPTSYQQYSGLFSNSANQQYQVSSGYSLNQNSGQNNIISSYDHPASGAVFNGRINDNINAVNTHFGQDPVELSAVSSYGPPPSGNPSGDSIAYGTQIQSKVVTANSIETNKENSEARGKFKKITSSVNDDGTDDQQLQLHHENNNYDKESDNDSNENIKDSLHGLHDSGLDIISAQKSQTVTIPVQGQLGNYQLEFQSSNSESGDNQNYNLDHPNHEKLLSQGLLQSIISAIEQPNDANESPQIISSDANDHIIHHQEVNRFLNSPQGLHVLNEPKIE